MPNMSLEEVFALARQRHSEGNGIQAEHLCRQILAIQPNHVDALHFLGAMVADSNRIDEGLALIRRAINITPTAGGFTNLGNALSRVGQFNLAAEAFWQGGIVAATECACCSTSWERCFNWIVSRKKRSRLTAGRWRFGSISPQLPGKHETNPGWPRRIT